MCMLAVPTYYVDNMDWYKKSGSISVIKSHCEHLTEYFKSREYSGNREDIYFNTSNGRCVQACLVCGEMFISPVDGLLYKIDLFSAWNG